MSAQDVSTRDGSPRGEKRPTRILVVDDEPKIRDLTGSILEEAGNRVTTAQSVDQAFEILAAGDVDLVLTDLNMPERDGLDLIRQLRDDYPDIPSIIVTGYASTDTAIEALRMGVSDYLKKPFRLDQLLEVVTRVLADNNRRESKRRWDDGIAQDRDELEHEEVRLRREIESASRHIESVEQRLERRSAVLRLVDEIQNRGSASYDLGELLDELLARVCKELHVERGSLLLIDPTDPGQLVVRAALGHGYALEKNRQRVPVDGSVSGWVASNRQCLRVDSIHAEGRFEWKNQHRYQSPSFLSVPLLVQDRAIGVLNLSEKATREAFSEEDEELTRILGTAIAGSIENHRLVQSTRDHQLETTRALVDSLEAKDPFIRGHSSRVTQHALRIAETMKLSLEERRIIYYGGHLHDIGKIGVPERILQKPGALTDDEFRAITLHPEIGARLLRRLSFVDEVKPIVRHHHERWDGRGYPDGLSGEEIPVLAAVVSIADAFDAMTSGRSYRNAASYAEAREEIRRHRGTQFRPDATDAFLDIPDFAARPEQPTL